MNNLISKISKFCFSPLTVGGFIREKSDIKELFNSGADKCVLNSSMFENITGGMGDKEYGSQSIVASIDIKKTNSGYKIYTQNGEKLVDITMEEAIKHVSKIGVGEILISSIDNDGSINGYDPYILNNLPKDLSIPIIINSGARKVEHFIEALKNNSIQAATISNVLLY